MSATDALRACRISSALTARAAPCSPAPRVISRPRMRSSAITGQRLTDPSGVIVPRSYPVACLATSASGQGQAADAQQCPQLRPGDDAVAGHEHEQEVILSAAYHERLDHIGGRHATCRCRLGQAAHRAVPDHAVGKADGLGGRQRGSGHSSVSRAEARPRRGGQVDRGCGAAR